LHDYDVPAILALPVDAAEPAYAKWIAGHISR
ncbi:divalent-cation tolerance protein CutA, partial [Salmonella enterica subsp. enterica serovar Typhimurium]